MDQTALLFRTPAGAVLFPAGTSEHLANVNTAAYKKIRIIAAERAGSTANVSFRVTALEGSNLVAHLAQFTLVPKSSRTFTIEVPARAVAIYADAASGSGNVAVDSWSTAHADNWMLDGTGAAASPDRAGAVPGPSTSQ